MPVTTSDIRARKGSDEKIVMVTAYDTPTARIVDAAGVEMILVGDSLGTNVLGLDSEARVTLDDMVHHARAVARGAQNPLLVGDLPFMSYKVSTDQALATSARMIQEGCMQAVKLEGGADLAATIRAITAAGIPVMGHIGLTPQSVNKLGGYRAQGRDLDGARSLVDAALALEGAGVFAIVLEAIPHRLAGFITRRVAVPTIGIGAGPDCDGQVQVIHDIAGWNTDFLPKHSKRFANVAGELSKAVTDYVDEVRAGSFPTERHSFRIKGEVMDNLEE